MFFFRSYPNITHLLTHRMKPDRQCIRIHQAIDLTCLCFDKVILTSLSILGNLRNSHGILWVEFQLFFLSIRHTESIFVFTQALTNSLLSFYNKIIKYLHLICMNVESNAFGITSDNNALHLTICLHSHR